MPRRPLDSHAACGAACSPVNQILAIDDGAAGLSVVTDVTMGGSSMAAGEVGPGGGSALLGHEHRTPCLGAGFPSSIGDLYGSSFRGRDARLSGAAGARRSS